MESPRIAHCGEGWDVATLRKYDPDQPRDDHGEWTAGGGGGGPSMHDRMQPGGDLHAKATESLKDPAFVAQHADRISRAGDEARSNFPGREATDEAHDAAMAHIHGEAMRIHAEEEAHGGDEGLREVGALTHSYAGDRGRDMAGRHEDALGAIARAKADREVEAAARANEDHAIAAGHVTTEARDVAGGIDSKHVEDAANEHASSLEQAHVQAADALHAVHAAADDSGEHVSLEHTHDLVDQFGSTHDAMSEAGLKVGGHDLEEHGHAQRQWPEHPDLSEGDHDSPEHDRAVAEHELAIATMHAEFKQRAETAQTALETLHEHQAAALAGFKTLHDQARKPAGDARDQLENMADDHHVNHEAFAHHERDYGADEHGKALTANDLRESDYHPEHDPQFVVDEHARQQYEDAHKASQTMRDHAVDQLDSHRHIDFGDAIDAVKEEMKSTGRAIKELSKHTGRAPRLAGKAKKGANRPEGSGSGNVLVMPPQRFRLRLSELKFVSPVDVPAQETAKVLLIKRDGTLSATATVAKIDDGLGLVFCWAFTSTTADGADYHDLQGDAIDQDFIKAAAEFMAGGGATDEMHDGVQTGRVVFAMPMTPEIAKAYGVETKTTGLMVALKPPPEVLAKFKSGEYTGVSIAGSGIREALKSAPACPSCNAYGKATDEKCAKCGAAMKRAPDVAKSTWSTADQDSLPDSSFLYVEGGGKRDADGKTTPRNLRHFPYRDATGKVDLPHLRDAIGRIPQSSLPKDVRDKLQVRAERLLGKQHDAAKRVAKQAVLTSATDGHQHSIDLDDPADGWTDQLSTSYQTSAGAPASHCHAWTYDATGKIAIAEDSGHTHSIDAIVPADVLATAARNETGERCPGCGEMADEGCRFCPKCGAAMDRRDAVPSATTDAGSGSGPAVVVVTARAPDRISPPSGAVPTVKSEPKEPTAMPDLNDKIRELEASNARLSKLASLTDAQRAHHGKLNGSDAEAFLSKSAHERDLVLSEIEKANEVVYTSTTTGAVFRKNDDLRVIDMAKRLDEATAAQKTAEIEKRELEFAKRGDETLGNFAKGTKGNLRGRIMRAINTEFTNPDEYAEAVTALKGANAAFKQLGTPQGASGAGEGPESNSVQKRLDVKIDEYAKTHKLSREQAMARATASDPEIRALYNEAQLAGN